MRRLMFGVIIAGVLIGWNGCGGGTWVEVTDDGCESKAVDEMNETLIMSGPIGTAACQAHGKGAFDGKFRCSGQTLQAACKG